jgi:Protein of unknown function (DUF3383)
MAIPVDQIVLITPSVISGGGAGIDLIAVMLTDDPRIPTGTLLSFPSSDGVGAYCGVLSTLYNLSVNYFLGFDNSNIKPGALYVFSFPSAPRSAFLRGISPPGGATLQNVQTITGTLNITIDGTVHTAGALSLAAATSLTGAATIIATALSLTTNQVQWDPITQSFVFSSLTTGATSTITAATGTAASLLGVDAASGPSVSQGAGIGVAATTMAAVKAASQNWATFMTTYNPDAPGAFTNKLAFTAWCNGQNNRFAYIAWDQDAVAAAPPGSACFGNAVAAGDYSGTMALYAPVLGATLAAFICGTTASIDTTETNGRITFAFKAQEGLVPDVTDGTIAQNLLANGYSFYGEYHDANNDFLFLNNGAVSGPFKWLDSYVNQIWFNAGLQQSVMTLMMTVKSLPYNQPGYDLVGSALQDPIDAAVNFGAIVAGVPLSNLQAAEVNTAAGVKIDTILTAVGYYRQVLPATAQVRALRQSPPCSIWYMDGQSIQKINVASVEVM